MKKTNTKQSSKLLQEPVNQHQKAMDEIAYDMAVLFERKIKLSEFAKWVVIARGQAGKDDLIWNLAYEILPGILEAKTGIERIDFLRKELPDAFCIYKYANESLFQLCEDYFKNQKGLYYFTSVMEDFMKVTFTLFAICEKFADYESIEKQMEKAA